MIKIGDLVAVQGKYGSTLGIVYDRLQGQPWEWTITEVNTGNFIPCSSEELTVIATRKQAEDWERKQKIKKLLDKSK